MNVVCLIVATCGVGCVERGGVHTSFVLCDCECGGDDRQRYESRHDEPSDHGASQRCCLFGTLSERERYRDHAGNHGACGHEDCPETPSSSFLRSFHGGGSLSPCGFGKR